MNVMICKLKKFGVRDEVTDKDENRKITAAVALKKLDEMKNFKEVNESEHLIIKVNVSDHLNMIFNKLFENLEQILNYILFILFSRTV